MDCVERNTDIALSQQPENKVVRNIIGVSEDGKWNHGYNEDTGKTTCIPIGSDCFSKHYHANKQVITCDICGCVILEKLGQHKGTMTCRLANFVLQDRLNLKESVITP